MMHKANFGMRRYPPFGLDVRSPRGNPADPPSPRIQWQLANRGAALTLFGGAANRAELTSISWHNINGGMLCEKRSG